MPVWRQDEPGSSVVSVRESHRQSSRAEMVIQRVLIYASREGRLKRLAGSAPAGLPAPVLLILLAQLSSSGLISAHPAAAGAPQHPTPAQPVSISDENALPGTTDWIMPDTRVASTHIQAYASAPSISPGQPLAFYVSTQQPGTAYTVQVYRLGWYGGAGGRLVLVSHRRGQAQGSYDPSSKKLMGCGSCFRDPQTDLVEARWQPSFSVTIPSSSSHGGLRGDLDRRVWLADGGAVRGARKSPRGLRGGDRR